MVRRDVDDCVLITLWALAPFAAGVGYLLTESVESAVAERLLVSAGHADAEHMSA